MPPLSPGDLLADLDPEQRQAVLATSGPVAIHAGAGSGKTRVISRRAAYAIATDVVAPEQALIVTFTERAAGEMVERLRTLGLPAVTARTFHAQALTQLRYFWPDRHGGEPLPELLDSKLPIIGRLARQLPGHYRFKPAKDLADEIEWAKARRIPPAAYERESGAAGRTPPVPVDLFVRTYAAYERTKAHAGRIDFEDLLLETVSLLEEDEDAARLVRSRKSWFSVDEYQDTNPLQERLLELWLGGRTDLCVVGDEDQTIYTFTGATPAYLIDFAQRHPGAREITLVRNYRSTPQVLDLANRLLAGQGRAKRLLATRAAGPAPAVNRYPSAAAELDALAAWIGRRIEAGTPPAEIAVLVRLNAQLADIEARLTHSGIAYQVRGTAFYARPEVRGALTALRSMREHDDPASGLRGGALASAVEARWRERLGLDEPEDPERGDETRERAASIETLVRILRDLSAASPDAGPADAVAELEARADAERRGSADGVNLLTYHRAKGLEWDAVALPSLEEGLLPVRQAADEETAIAEERRLLYVGITRAREHLLLSWAEMRPGRGGVDGRRRRSRFLVSLDPPRVRTGNRPMPSGSPRTSGASRTSGRTPPPTGDALFDALRAWRRERASELSMPAYVIAHDAALAAIAAARPESLDALGSVPGIGPSTVAKYGAEILDLVAAHAEPPG